MKTFFTESSIVKEIWGTTDVTLFIFAGASAEYALNTHVDWLYFTGKLPADPIGRLFATVHYAQDIIFKNEGHAMSTIDGINAVHYHVESARGHRIPENAYKDVLYMLIHYSIAAFELLERKLTGEEKDEVVNTFRWIGEMMHLHDLPASDNDWSHEYGKHLSQHLVNSDYTKDLFKQYSKHLGPFRYFLLLEIQRMLVPVQVNRLLRLGKPRVAQALVPFYRLIRKTFVAKLLLEMMVPGRFRQQMRQMDHSNTMQHRHDTGLIFD